MRLQAFSTRLFLFISAFLFLGLLAVSANAEPAEAGAPSSVQGASPSPSAAPTTPETSQNNSAPDAPGAAKPASNHATAPATAAKPNETKPASEPATEGAGAPNQAPAGEATESGGGQEKAAPSEPATPKSNIVVNIDKSTQEMTVFVDGIEQYRWPVSTGVRGYSTPSGTFQARSMNKIWYSKQWDNAPMPHAIFFTKQGHAIHGTLEEKRLGTAASHGCVRLSRENAATLFSLVEKNGLENTQIVLVGTTPGGEAKVASQGPSRRYQQDYPPPWFEPGMPFYAQPAPRQRRGLFRRWFQPGAQGYYAPPRYYPPRY